MTLGTLRHTEVQEKDSLSQSLPTSESKGLRYEGTRGHRLRVGMNKREEKTEQSDNPAFVFVTGSPSWEVSPGRFLGKHFKNVINTSMQMQFSCEIVQ